MSLLPATFIIDDAIDSVSIRRRKREMRNEIKSELQGMSKKELNGQSNMVISRVISLPELMNANTVGVFLSMATGEVQTCHFLEWLFDNEKRVFVPKIVDAKLGIMVFVEVLTLSELELFPKDKFGIPDPPMKLSTASEIDFVLVPGLAFDRSGSRLGRGRGFYDHILPSMSKAAIVGVCFESQLKMEVPFDPTYDRKVSLVVTPSEIIR